MNNLLQILLIGLLSYTGKIVAQDGSTVTVYEGKRIEFASQKFHHMEKHIPRDSFIQRGRSSGSTSHEVFIAIHQNNIPELKQSVLDRATPGHPLYQQWMNFEEVGNMVKNEEAYKAVVDWLEAYEVKITWTSPYEEYVKAIAPIATWETMLSTHFYEFEDLSHAAASSSKGRLFHRALEYWIPAELTKSIDAIFHTVQTPPRFRPHYHRRISKEPNEGPFPYKNKPHRTYLRNTAASSVENILKPLEVDSPVTIDFINNLYQIGNNTAVPTLNQSVFETGSEFFSPSDLSLFQEQYSLPIQSVTSIGGHAVTTCVENTTMDCFEGNLDVQYITGIAQQTTTFFWYVSAPVGDPFVIWIEEVIAEQYPPQSNSISWGENESQMSAATVTAWEIEAAKLTGRGVTILVSSGDDGAPNLNDNNECDCNLRYDPSFPATSEWVTSVGATMGPETGGKEVVCSSREGGVITSGGGFSTFVQRPSYQDQAITKYFDRIASSPPESGYTVDGRGFPDVALIGVNYQIFVDQQLNTVFGTSCSTPVFAAFVTLVNSARFRQGKSAIGFINPTLYTVGYEQTIGATSSLNPTFNDVTSGNNKCCSYGYNPSDAVCCSSGFTAVKGWDPTTGWGSIDYTDFALIFQVSASYSGGANDDSSDTSSKAADLSANAITVIIVVVILIVASSFIFYCFFYRGKRFAPNSQTVYPTAPSSESFMVQQTELYAQNGAVVNAAPHYPPTAQKRYVPS